MKQVTYDQIPKEDLDRIKARLAQKIYELDEQELYNYSQSEKDFTDYLVNAFREVAKLLGYVIAIPVRIARGIGQGFMDGFKSGLDRG